MRGPASPRYSASCLAILLLAATVAGAATHQIPEHYPTIQQGIDASADGDTVLVGAGAYVENIDFSAKRIIVASHFLVTGDSTAIDATAIVSAMSGAPVVTIAGGQGRETLLCGFLISGAIAFNGHGVLVNGASPTMTRNHIWNNHTTSDGGGISVESGAPLIRHNRIDDNSAGNQGGGIYVYGGAAEIVSNVIRDNDSAWDGGGISVMYAAPSIRGNHIEQNTSYSRGGGIFAEHSEPVIIDNEICYNTVQDYSGGGITSRNCTPVIERNRIHHNQGGDIGGGIFY